MPYLFNFHVHSGNLIINGLLSGQALKTVFVFRAFFSPPYCSSPTFAFEFAPECGPSMSWVQEPLHILEAASWNCRAGTWPGQVKHVGLLWKEEFLLNLIIPPQERRPQVAWTFPAIGKLQLCLAFLKILETTLCTAFFKLTLHFSNSTLDGCMF